MLDDSTCWTSNSKSVDGRDMEDVMLIQWRSAEYVMWYIRIKDSYIYGDYVKLLKGMHMLFIYIIQNVEEVGSGI